MNSIKIQDYTIFFSENFLEIESYILSKNYTKIFTLVDENTLEKCLPLLPFLKQTKIIQIQSGEKHKNIETCQKIWSELLINNADRKSLLINLGGGVITDMGGFCAATYKRGIDFINIPTTLLAQVDATVGGKTGIDFNGLKNMIGLFKNPSEVFINHNFLKTLNIKHLKSGYAEIIKHGLIHNETYFLELKKTYKLQIENILPLIIESVSIKKEIVENDPFEQNTRKTLNFGHTIGHAIESCFLNTPNELLHGEAIALGMIGALYLSNKKCNFPTDSFQEIAEYLKDFFEIKIDLKPHLPKLQKLILNDKKNADSNVNFILLEGIGKPLIDCKVNYEEIEDAICFIDNFINENE